MRLPRLGHMVTQAAQPRAHAWVRRGSSPDCISLRTHGPGAQRMGTRAPLP